ncbi:MAG: chromosome segregation protein SMC [Halobacteriales archaeon]
MHIQRLVLDDFKSFGRPTEIPFYEDFTTVSGPNGSGKSNIIDAVLFALGLARSHGIRAEKLTDLIYNPGFEDDEVGAGPNEASVEVVLDNEDRALTREQVVAAAGSEDIGDVDRIRIKRRVKETEANYYSYYYLNGRSVNLSDIRDLLSQVGVTPEGYNVVMQGDVTEIINTTPYRRREILDEIAGVAQFDAKKEDAFEELDAVKDRIEEAELRIEEKQGRLEELEDERETALEYRELREEKAEYEGYRKAAELEDKREELAGVEADIEAREDELADLREILETKKDRVIRLEDDLEKLNREIERKGEDEQLQLQREIEEIKGEISRLEGEIGACEDRIEEAEHDRREAFVKVDRKQEEVDATEEEIADAKTEKASLKVEKKHKESELESIEAEIAEIGAEYEELKADLDGKKEALEDAKSAKNELQREQDRLLDEARRRSTEREDAESEIEAARERIPEIEAEIADLEDELEKARHNESEMASVLSDLRAEREELKDSLSTIEEGLRRKREEYAELDTKASRTGDDSWPRAVSTVLSAGMDGVHGAVGQLGSVDDRYATACETAAGGRLANVVVDDDGVGQSAIEYLKSRNAGRATFLPLTEMDDRSLPRLPNREGVIDFAYELVDFEEAYTGVFSYVLGETVVVDTMATARALMGEYRMVTLDGDLVERSGAMTGGSGGGSRYSFSKSGTGQLDRVAARIKELEEKRAGVQEDINSVESRIENAREKKSEATEEVRKIETAIDGLENDREEIETRIDDLEERLAEIEREREEVDDRMGEIEADIADHEAEIADIEADIADIEAELADSRIPELSAEADDLRAEIETLEDGIDDIDGRLNELELKREYAEEAIEDLQGSVEAAQNRKAEAEERIAELEAAIEEKGVVLEEKHAEVADLEDELTELKDEREGLTESLRTATEARDETMADVRSTERRIERLREEANGLEAEIADLEEAVGEYDPGAIPDHEEVTDTIERIEGKMEALEPVNMRAIDAYEEVEAELADLQERKATLVEEREGIQERIDSYERQKKETFIETFEAIDEQFRDVFERLSDGTGELHLENEDDPFEGGLTMKAQPGDKPVQRLDAMSGGEKSLTALAFIFAVQRHNPAPFYALDEIDAFLDAANAERVGEMLDELAADAQFVVVSHRSAMLERSERAIGVTMQENNVSSVTGIAMADGGAGGDDDRDTGDPPETRGAPDD